MYRTWYDQRVRRVLIEQHWDGIAAYCRPENNVALGFVGGLNTTIRVIQPLCSGLRDDDCLHLNIFTCRSHRFHGSKPQLCVL